jgi:hypothetical protein
LPVIETVITAVVTAGVAAVVAAVETEGHGAQGLAAEEKRANAGCGVASREATPSSG